MAKIVPPAQSSDYLDTIDSTKDAPARKYIWSGQNPAKMKPNPVYVPPPDLHSQLDDFLEYINRRHGVDLKKYDDLHRFSTTRLNDFWLSLWSFAGFKASRQPHRAIDDDAKIDAIPAFFEGVRLNFAENILRTHSDDAVAVIDVDETTLSSGGRRVTWQELRHRVARASQALRRLGIQRGDVVALVGSNSSESLVLLLASAAVGAVFSSFAADVGENALLDRLGQLSPKLLAVQLRYRYNGKEIDIAAKIVACHKMLQRSGPTILAAVGADSDSSLPEHFLNFNQLVHAEHTMEVTFEMVEFNAPLAVMFSSGTTGTPKGIVHGHGGLMMNGWKENFLHNDFGPADIYFHHSGIGWTLWNISLGALFCNSTLVLYDGSPMYPSCAAFLKALFALGLTAFGSSPRYFYELQTRHVRAKDLFPSGQVRMLLSTGALLTPGLAKWLAQSFGPVCQIGFSGGTELCGSFMMGIVGLPSYPGEIAVKALGMAVECFDVNGQSCPAGSIGELVCTRPFPNMPVSFWNDPGSQKYRNAYFASFKGESKLRGRATAWWQMVLQY